MGGWVAMAAGNFLGSWLGGKLAGLDDKKGPTTPQLDAGELQETYKYYKRAGQVQEEYYLKGLNFYKQSLTKAAAQIKTGYRQAAETLEPMRYTGMQSFNTVAKYMGLDPVTDADLAAKKIANIGYDGRFQALSTQMDLANALKDPNERMKAKQGLVKELENLSKNPYPNKIKELGPRDALVGITGSGDWNKFYDSLLPLNKASYDLIGRDKVGHWYADRVRWGEKPLPTLEANRKRAEEDKKKATIAAIQEDWNKRPDVAEWYKDYDRRVKELQAEEAGWLKDKDEMRSLFAEWERNYGPEKEMAYEGAKKTAELRKTPGYKGQVAEGTRGVETSSAAGVRDMAPNLETALAEYGQKVGDNYYSPYLSSVGNTSAQNLPAQFQVAQNALNEQIQYSNLTTAGGQASLNTYQGIGDAWAEAYNKIGETSWDAEKFNTDLKFQDYMRVMGQKDAMSVAAMNAAPQLGFMSLANRKFNYQQQQNQNVGAGYMMNQNQSSGKYYQGYGGLMFRNWGAL